METQEQKLESKHIGYGTLSLVLSVFVILFEFSYKGNPSLGDRIVTALGFAAWSGGSANFHNTILYSIPIALLAAVLGFVFPKDYGAKTGRNLAILLALLGVLAWCFATSAG